MSERVYTWEDAKELRLYFLEYYPEKYIDILVRAVIEKSHLNSYGRIEKVYEDLEI
jgi:hypothetical protein